MIDRGNDYISRMLKTAIKDDTKVFYAVFWARVYVLRSQKLLEDAGIELCYKSLPLFMYEHAW